MRTTITRIVDPEALGSVAPAALRAYAQSQGWSRVESYGEHSDVYVRQTDGPEAILPGTAALGDYASVVADLVALFASVEGRNEAQVFRDLSTSDRDVIRIRAPEAEDDGSVKIEAGVDLVTNARDLLLSAACSAWQAKPAYRAGKVKEASDYMGKVRLGQTEHGSFVLTLLAPVPPAFTNLDQAVLFPDFEEEPFERKVTRRFVDGLEAARHAVERYNRGDGFEAFERAVERGVSANLCAAAAALIEQGDGLDVSMTWARTRRVPESVRRIQFASADGEILKEAARLFYDRQPRENETLEGFIVRANRDTGQAEGSVTLKTFIDGRSSSVKVEFSSQLYSAALEAHDKRQPVAVTGELKRVGARWRLDAARDFRVIADEDSASEPAAD